MARKTVQQSYNTKRLGRSRGLKKNHRRRFTLVLLVVGLGAGSWYYYDTYLNHAPAPAAFQTETGVPPLPPEFGQ